jgi:hypothetical protein
MMTSARDNLEDLESLIREAEQHRLEHMMLVEQLVAQGRDMTRAKVQLRILDGVIDVIRACRRRLGGGVTKH